MVRYFFISLFSIFSVTRSEVQIRILDSNIQNGKPVNIEIINNTNKNYCFIIDTMFYYSKEEYYGGSFINPKIFLFNCNNIDLPIIRDVRDFRSKKDVNKNDFAQEFNNRNDTLIVNESQSVTKKNKTLTFLTLKKGESLKIKIPFFLVVKYLKENVYQYYDINRKGKYKGNITYLINHDFITKNCSKKQIDSISRKGFDIFEGTLNSNKVPLIIEQNKKQQ